jgi:hypothetical protein
MVAFTTLINQVKTNIVTKMAAIKSKRFIGSESGAGGAKVKQWFFLPSS